MSHKIFKLEDRGLGCVTGVTEVCSGQYSADPNDSSVFQNVSKAQNHGHEFLIPCTGKKIASYILNQKCEM